MDKNTIIGFTLIGLVLVFFTWLNRPTPEQIAAQRRQDSLAMVEAARLLAEEQVKQAMPATAIETTDSLARSQRNNAFGVFAAATEGEEDFVTLANNLLEVRISGKGGFISYARLKDYVTHDSLPLILFDNGETKLDFTLVTAANRIVNTSDLFFTPITSPADPHTVIMRLYAGNDSAYLDFAYTLPPNEYMLRFDIAAHNLDGILSPSVNTLDLAWEQNIRQLEKGRKYENQYTGLFYKFLADDVENLSQSADASVKLSNRLRWIAYKNKFFSTTLIADDGFESPTLTSNPLQNIYLKRFAATAALPFDLTGDTTHLRYYIGPNKYALLKAFDAQASDNDRLELEKLVPMGISLFRAINKYFIIPIFDFLCNYIHSLGLVILLLTLIVKTLLFPLTYKSYMSTAKMRVLRPQVEEINARYPGPDKALERQKAAMELYRRAGASPMSGCLPMLLQMPVLFALYMFFPTSIELRQQSFLWAHDLSTYDAIFTWNAYIPLVSQYFGNHVSLFCLLMTLTNILYSKYNMDMSNTGQQQMPGMKLMMLFMPLMLLVFLNQFAAGLNYYYFISTLISIGQTALFRLCVNEQKLLDKLEANKKKPHKQSGLLKRLEDLQRQQQALLRQQQQQKQQKQKPRK